MKTKTCIGIVSIAIVLTAFQPVSGKQLNVICTLPSLASITESIAGEYADVESITKGAQDAHYVEAKPSYMVKLHKADLLIYSGLELEIGWLPLLIQGSRNSKINPGARGNLNASSMLETEDILEKPRGEVDRSMGDVHPSGNPHYLLNPRNALKVAQLIADRLIELDPAHQPQYESNLKSFFDRLNAKIKEFESAFAPIEGKEIVCYHPHWSYLLNWLKLTAVTYIEPRPGIPPTPKHKKETIDLMRIRNIKVVIISSWKEPTKAKEVAAAVGARLLILPGEVNAVAEASDYISWIQYMVNHIVSAYTES